MRQLAIANDLIKWADAIPGLIARIDEVLKLPRLTEAQTLEIEAIAERIEALFRGIREAVNDRNYDRVTACIDRLRDEITAGDATLERFVQKGRRPT
jgi:hypothetical protein